MYVYIYAYILYMHVVSRYTQAMHTGCCVVIRNIYLFLCLVNFPTSSKMCTLLRVRDNVLRVPSVLNFIFETLLMYIYAYYIPSKAHV